MFLFSGNVALVHAQAMQQDRIGDMLWDSPDALVSQVEIPTKLHFTEVLPNSESEENTAPLIEENSSVIVRDYLSLYLPETESKWKLNIFAPEGKVLLQKEYAGGGLMQLNVLKLGAGRYFLRLSDGSKTIHQEFRKEN